MKNIFRIAIALGVALVIASCEGLEANKVTFPVEEGKAWLFKHVTESLKKNVAEASASRTVKRMDVNFNKESAGTGVYLVSGNMQNGTEFSYEFRLVQEGTDFNIESSDAPKYFFE